MTDFWQGYEMAARIASFFALLWIAVSVNQLQEQLREWQDEWRRKND